MDVTQPWRPLEASPGSTLPLAAPTPEYLLVFIWGNIQAFQ